MRIYTTRETNKAQQHLNRSFYIQLYFTYSNLQYTKAFYDIQCFFCLIQEKNKRVGFGLFLAMFLFDLLYS